MGEDKLAHIREWLPARRWRDRTPLDLERVTAFGDQARQTQFEVLQELRHQSTTDLPTVSLALGAVALAFLALVYPAADAWSDSSLANFITALLLAVVVVLCLIPTMAGLAREMATRELAIVWLAAYEDELNRRRSQPGWSGRRWRRAH